MVFSETVLGNLSPVEAKSPYRTIAVAARVSGTSKVHGQDRSPAIKIGVISAAAIAWPAGLRPASTAGSDNISS
jgi:hypothetical protein